MPNFTAGTSFTDGVTNDVTAAKLNALVADAVPTSNLSLNSTTGTIANFTASTANITLGTIPTLTAGTTTSTNDVVTNGTITNLSATTSTFLGAITGSTNVVNIGSGQIYKDASGRVGIGTTSPANKLHIVNSGAGALVLQTTAASSDQTQITFSGTTGDKWAIGNNAATGGTGTNFDIYDLASSANRLRIDSSGNVGVGTNNPSTPSGKCLTIYDSSIPRLNLKNSTSGDTSTDGVELYINGSDSVLNNRENGTFAFCTNNQTRLLIDSSGRVGIGTSSPDATLQVVRATSQTDIDGVNQVATFLNTSSDTSGNLTGIRLRQDNATNVAQGFIGLSSTGNSATRANLVIATPNTSGNSTERLRIDSSGNVGIGVTSPTGIGSNYTTLDIRGSSGGGVGLGSTSAGQFAQIYAVNLDSSLRIQNTSASGFTNFTTNNTERLRIDSSGNVGIGVTAPVNKLEVVGSFGRGAPVTKTGDFTLADTENWLIVNKGSSCTVTLPAASSWTGREFTIKVITAHAVISASSNVVPRNSATAGTAILTNVAGSWATLVSNGTNWVIMCGS